MPKQEVNLLELDAAPPTAATNPPTVFDFMTGAPKPKEGGDLLDFLSAPSQPAAPQQAAFQFPMPAT